MDGHGNNAVPELFWMTCLDGVPVPIPDSIGLTWQWQAGGGFTFPAHDGHRAAIKTARQMDHYWRVRRNASRMPEVAKVVGGEDVLVDLMYGDVDEACRLFEPEIAPIAPPPCLYTTGYAPNC